MNKLTDNYHNSQADAIGLELIVNHHFVIIMVVMFTIFREYYIIEDKFPVDGLCWLLRSHNPTMKVLI